MRTNELDLHGIRHDDVPVMVEDFILSTPLPALIITGNSAAMKRIVIRVITDNSFGYIDGIGSNLGCIVAF